jgi:hypothetical protein
MHYIFTLYRNGIRITEELVDPADHDAMKAAFELDGFEVEEQEIPDFAAA